MDHELMHQTSTKKIGKTKFGWIGQEDFQKPVIVPKQRIE